MRAQNASMTASSKQSPIEPIDTARSSQNLAVLAAGGVVVAGAVVGAVLMFGGDVRVRDPELAPAPSTAPAADDGLSPGASDSTGERAAASPGVLTTLPSGERSDPEPVKSGTVQGAVETSAADWDPEFAVEIVEELAPTEAAGGARQVEPVEPVEPAGPEESDGTGISGRAPSAQGDAYTWHDGDRMVEARLQLDLVVITEDVIAPNEDAVADMGDGQIVTRSAERAGGTTGAGGASGEAGTRGQPVFLSESGELMALPGGVILVLDGDWDSDSTGGFFARNNISLDRVSELDYVTNGFFVETEAGFPSLDLANALATQDGVELSSPNWWRERTAR